MKYYSISFPTKPTEQVKREFLQRRDNLKTTQIFWIVTGVEIDPYFIDCTYKKSAMILIWLN